MLVKCGSCVVSVGNVCTDVGGDACGSGRVLLLWLVVLMLMLCGCGW